MKINFKHNTQLRVRYGETDQMGYCYYGNYAEYFEVGRVEALRSIGMSYKSLEDNGIMLPVSELEVKYKAPALYDDNLTIETTIESIDKARIYFSYLVTNEKEQLLVEAKTTLVFVNKENMRPTRPPEFFLEKIKTFIDRT